jgi:hypothetical protein
MKTRRTVVAPVSAGSTVGKCRRKIVPDCIELADLGCHAFKDGTIPKGRSIMRHNLSANVRVR